jgi:glycosyltransferase involved in cell wall biosynthesis
MSTVCLAVMAKNEAHVIARCLASAKPLVDSWVLVDTGSTDATIAVANETMKDLPGEVVERPWRDFAQGRTDSFELARLRADYTLFLDADDALEYPSGARFPELTEPGYTLTIHDGPLLYPRVQLFKNALPWRFEGVRHDVATCAGVVVTARIDGIRYRRFSGEGARSRDPLKYARDAEALEEDLRRDPSNARNVFYLARSYEDAGDLTRALAQFERRALMGGWDEEAFYARFAAAGVRRKLRLPDDRVATAYLEAWNARTHRAEPLFALATLARDAEDWKRARDIAAVAMAIPFPSNDALFIHHEIYAWRALDEYAHACAKLHDWDAAVDACRKLLARDLPATDRARVEANLASCEAAARAKLP